ncbi:pleckstrin homology domain-containing family A member 5 isoform X2 [Conger conger]|uniref:pleckstrin homology domain-containing family A member 5 isoform X2 n=1 Tax=Conger conger TaxID=82655 RepID=UPI002A59E5F0|nr:pleckstrin homology domain-containing family A member 5 isoform X2 [Conger conger]
MAADLNPEWLSCLPSSWSYGVTRDGRVFFINEEAKSTTWLHPVTGEAVITGHRKTPDLPTGWEEGYTFEGARCFINHNERKVTCKHPVSGLPSQDNCIFVVNEQTAPKTPTPVPANEKKERPVSTMSEASNYTGGSDYATHPVSPAGRASRSSKKIHNFGKRSNSIKRNPNAPVVKSNWLYKQDSTGMKLWKKRWFVLCDMCLFYYRDEKEEGILGSILLPSFHVSMLSVDDHINRKYAFKATHPNMRTYYFCTDTAKEMESWMKVMTDAALVHTDPVKRMDRLKVEHRLPQEVNNVMNHRVLTRPEAQNNERNREAAPPPLALPPEERKQKDAEKYGFQQDGVERPLTKINSVKLQPAQAAAIAAAVNSSRQQANSAGTAPPALYKPPQVNGSGDRTPGEVGNALPPRAPSQAPAPAPAPAPEPERTLQRTNSMQQLEQWVRVQRGRGQEEETRSITSYQTLPRNMPSHRAQVVPLYPEGYRTLPRNMLRPDSICSMSPSVYDRALGPQADKRRSMRDDTMWQLFEWQQRQAYTKQGPPLGYGTLPSPKTMVNLSEHVAHSIPPSPSHGSLAHYQGYSPLRSYSNMSTRSEVSSPVFRGDVSIDRRHRPHIPKYAYPPDRRSMPAGIPAPTITPQALQGKTPEELTLLLIKLRRQQAELNSVREHTLTQLMQLNLDTGNPKNEILSHHLQRNLMYLDSQMKENEPLIIMSHTMIENSAPRPQLYQQVTPDDYRDNSYIYRPEELDIDAKLSRLCEQDKVVRTQEDKLQQLHREKHTLETALLSASQEIELSADNPAAVQCVVQQRDVLQSGLLSTCRELSRVNNELDRSWREYDRLETDVTLAKNNLLEQLEALGSPQTEPPSQQHVQIQKELWRIQDVMEALSKNKPQRSTDNMGFLGNPISNKNKSEGPDYRLYKSEPELTTVAEVDETNGEDKSEPASEKDPSGKGMSYPVGIVPPRTKSPMPESSTIASYVTLRKTKKPEPRTDRPRSAVDQLCQPDAGRPRMSVEEQLERIRRHQQASLRERKKGLNVLGAQENSPSRTPSFSKENPFRTAQGRKREEVLSSDIQELEASLREQDLVKEQETPAEEIARLKEVAQQESYSMERELSKPEKVVIPERYVELEPEEALSPEEEADKQKKVDRIKALIAKNSMQSVVPTAALSPQGDAEEESPVAPQEKIINISYELAAEASKRSKLVAVNLSTPPQSPTSPSPPPQLADGSHFMCV